MSRNDENGYTPRHFKGTAENDSRDKQTSAEKAGNPGAPNKPDFVPRPIPIGEIEINDSYQSQTVSGQKEKRFVTSVSLVGDSTDGNDSSSGSAKDSSGESGSDSSGEHDSDSESSHGHHHHHHHRHSGGSNHHHKHKSRRLKKHRAKKVVLTILSVILVLIIGVVLTFFVLHEIGRRSFQDREGMEIVTPTADESGDEIITKYRSGRTITYKGVTYEFNEDVIAMTLIGIDRGDGSNNNLQMSDAIYVLTIDTKTGEAKIVGISRDTMTDVDIYSAEGDYIDAEKRQIAYSYAYHSKYKTGGDNTNKSVSRVFYGLPFKNYFAINLEAFNTLNDIVGGVTVTSKMTFESPVDGRTISEGETVTLYGKEAQRYVQKRDVKQLESNNTRMERQQQYIRAFLSTAFGAVKSDLSVISDLYNAISENSDSSLSLPELTYIASTAVTKLKSADDVEYITLKGDIVAGQNAEMYVSDETALTTMLDVFYQPVS